MKTQSKYSLNMNEADSRHLTAENKQHLSITLVFKRILHVILLYYIIP